MTPEVRVLPPHTPARPVAIAAGPLPPPPSPASEEPLTPDDGYTDGYRAGEAAGRAEALAVARGLLDQIGQVLTDTQTTLAAVGDRARLAHEAATRSLAIELAEAVLTTYWRQDSDVRRAVLTSLLDALPPTEPITLTTAADPDAARLWTETAAALVGEAAARLQWRADPALAWPDVIARWDHGGWWGGLRATLWALAHPEEAPPL